MFHQTADELESLCAMVLEQAKSQGATAAEVDASESNGQSVQVRLGAIEQIEHQQEKSLDITVYVNQAKGRASTGDFSPQAIADTVQAALSIARYTAQDDCAGLADASLMAKNLGDVEAFHPWLLTTDEAIELALACESAGRQADARITNSEGAGIQISHYHYVYANSHGFSAYQNGSRHGLSCSLVATGSDGLMQRDYWYDSARNPKKLQDAATIGTIAARRTVQRLGARSIPTGTYPVVFDTTVSGSLIGHLAGALSGGALYRQTSFLTDSIGQRILAPWVVLQELPHIPEAFGSTYFDAEGVATQPRTIVDSGYIQGYFLDSYSARKLGMQTTANAGGIHNLHLNATHTTQTELLKEMGTGLLITELMGQGVNSITGDYSRGAAGYWVENGEIQHPVEEITIASRLQDMYLGMVGAAHDALHRSTHKVGSILIDHMTVGGH